MVWLGPQVGVRNLEQVWGTELHRSVEISHSPCSGHCGCPGPGTAFGGPGLQMMQMKEMKETTGSVEHF